MRPDKRDIPVAPPTQLRVPVTYRRSAYYCCLREWRDGECENAEQVHC